jgi:hypothetical protein
MNMHRARRLASVAVVASLAVTGLSACRSQPTVAAYVGDQRITEDQVQSIWDNAKAAPAATDANGQAAPFSLQRADIVQVLASLPVLDTIAKADGVTAPSPDAAQASQMTLLPPTTAYTKAFAQQQALLTALLQKNQNAPAAPDADVQQVYNNLITIGQAPPGDFAAFKSSLSPQQGMLINASAAVGKEISREAGPLNVRVNPRYGTVSVPLIPAQSQTGEVVSLISAPLNPSVSPAPVVDQS